MQSMIKCNIILKDYSESTELAGHLRTTQFLHQSTKLTLYKKTIVILAIHIYSPHSDISNSKGLYKLLWDTSSSTWKQTFVHWNHPFQIQSACSNFGALEIICPNKQFDISEFEIKSEDCCALRHNYNWQLITWTEI